MASMKLEQSLKLSFYIMTCCLSIILNSCATTFAPEYDQISIKTVPEGASVYDCGEFLGVTPLIHSFKRNSNPNTVLLKMDGWKSQELTLSQSVEKTTLLNLAPLLAINGNPFDSVLLTSTSGMSWIVDGAEKRIFKYDPKSYMLVLEKNGTAADSGTRSYSRRLRFALLNHHYLIFNIAQGGGEYLQAYYEMKYSDHDHYQAFLTAVLLRSKDLYDANDALVFFYKLEEASGLASI